MKKVLCALVAVAGLLVFSGCVNVSYVGTSYPPTTKVAVYYGKNTVPKGTYNVMGKAIFTAEEGVSSSRLKEKIKDKAEAEGADALVIISMHRVLEGKSVAYDYPYCDDPGFDWDDDGFWGPPYGPMVDSPPEANVEYIYDIVARTLFLKKRQVQAPAP